MLIHFHDGIMENEIKFSFVFLPFFSLHFSFWLVYVVGMVYITLHITFWVKISTSFFSTEQSQPKKKHKLGNERRKFRENLKIQCNFIIFVFGYEKRFIYLSKTGNEKSTHNGNLSSYQCSAKNTCVFYGALKHFSDKSSKKMQIDFPNFFFIFITCTTSPTRYTPNFSAITSGNMALIL